MRIKKDLKITKLTLSKIANLCFCHKTNNCVLKVSAGYSITLSDHREDQGSESCACHLLYEDCDL